MEEDDKPEEDKETKEGRVVGQGKDIKDSNKSSSRQEMDRMGSERLPAGWM